MQRTLKRELKELETVKKEGMSIHFERNSQILLWGIPDYVGINL
jgi:hypothetical protein